MQEIEKKMRENCELQYRGETLKDSKGMVLPTEVENN